MQNKTHSKILNFGLILLVLFSGVTCLQDSKNISLTTTEKRWLAQHKNDIKIVNGAHIPPAMFYNDKNEYVGIIVDFQKLIEKKLHIKFKEIRVETWSNALHTLQQKKADIIIGIAHTPDRSKYLTFTNHLFEIPYVIVTSKHNKNSNTTIDELAGKKIAAPKDYAIIEYLNRRYKGLSFVEFDDHLEGLQMVSMGSVEALISNQMYATYLAEKNGITNLKIAGHSGYINSLSVGTSKDKKILARIIEKAVAHISEKERTAILRKWIKLDRPDLFNKEVWGYALLVIILISFGILTWNIMLKKEVKHRTRELHNYKNNLKDIIKKRTKELEHANSELKKSLSQVKQMSGLLPICANCKKIRDDKGYWAELETYIEQHSEALFSHSICQHCADELYKDEDWYEKSKEDQSQK
jgi:ABC-type amino acid transport substrate-binding protein